MYYEKVFQYSFYGQIYMIIFGVLKSTQEVEQVK